MAAMSERPRAAAFRPAAVLGQRKVHAVEDLVGGDQQLLSAEAQDGAVVPRADGNQRGVERALPAQPLDELEFAHLMV
jgi:hypothetical protein